MTENEPPTCSRCDSEYTLAEWDYETNEFGLCDDCLVPSLVELRAQLAAKDAQVAELEMKYVGASRQRNEYAGFHDTAIREVDRLRAELEGVNECAKDEEVAHRETLRLLAAKDAVVEAWRDAAAMAVKFIGTTDRDLQTQIRTAINAARALDAEATASEPTYDLVAHLVRQQAFSLKTFGPGDRVQMVLKHIRKELIEVEKKPKDVTEWIDVVLLALDGAWRSGHSPAEVAAALKAKLTKNERRKWPDWRTAPSDVAMEHIRDAGRYGEKRD